MNYLASALPVFQPPEQRVDYLIERVNSFSAKRVAVLGDFMLDRYLIGSVERISPEAPVPVLRVTEERCIPGGAGNTCMNLRALGARVVAVGIIGSDTDGRQLRRQLAAAGVDVSWLIQDPQRRTTVKCRALADGRHHMLRLDWDDCRSPSDRLERAVLRALAEVLPGCDALLISDYAKGMVTSRIAATAIRLATDAGVITCVDPKGRQVDRYRGATVLKPNLRELGFLVGTEAERLDDVIAAAQKLLVMTGSRLAVVTLGVC